MIERASKDERKRERIERRAIKEGNEKQQIRALTWHSLKS